MARRERHVEESGRVAGPSQIIHRGEQSLRPVREVFARNTPFFVVPGRVAIDFYDCTVIAKPAGCREVNIYRHDLKGRLLKTFHVTLEERYPECQVLAPREDGLFIHAVSKDRPWDHCSDFPGLGVSRRGLELFEVLD